MNSSFDIPLPFATHTNPYVSLVEDRNLQWARRMRLLPSPAAAERLSRSRIGDCASFLYPFAALPDLIVCAGWMTWTLVVDDQIDEGHHSRPEEWANVRARLERIVDSKGILPEDETDVPAYQALADLCRRTFPHMSNACIDRVTNTPAGKVNATGCPTTADAADAGITSIPESAGSLT